MTIGDLWLGNSRSKMKGDASVLEKVTCNLFLGRNVTSYLKAVTTFKCNGSVTVTSYCYFESNETVTSYLKKLLVT
jgi:hypothetical protein